MARFVVGAVLGLAVGIVAGAAAGLHASSEDDPDLVALADQAGVPVGDLAGALSSQPDVSARDYLIFDGKLAAPVVWPTGRLACIARRESQNDPHATNPRSKAAGLFQFLWSTWMTTPQGKVGESPYDPSAATAAAQWMVSVGRVNEWEVVQRGLCP